MKLAYITQEYPSLTTTFIYREVLALEKRGFTIDTFAIWRPDPHKVSVESRPLIDKTTYVLPRPWREFIPAHGHYLLHCPLRYLTTLWFVLTYPGESWRNRKRTLGHFIEAVYLARAMEQRGIGHIHAHFTINAASIALIIARLLKITFSFTAHNIFFTDRLLLPPKLREARFAVAISEFSKAYLLRLVGDAALADKVHIVHCGVSPTAFAPPATRQDNPEPHLLFVAQLAERKGAPYLVEACRLLKERGVPFRCFIVGNGAQMGVLTERVTRYGLQDQVVLTGALLQEDLKPYLETADIFVLPCITAADGDMDGVPVSLMEAMAMAIATVSTSVSGIPELIQNGVNGMLVAEKDADALAEALQALIVSPTLRARLGEQGRQQIKEAFNVDRNAEHLAELFERYLT